VTGRALYDGPETVRCPFCRPTYAAARVSSAKEMRAHLTAEHTAAEVIVASLLIALRHPIRATRVLWEGRTERRRWKRDEHES
jgi:hypothetical protein